MITLLRPACLRLPLTSSEQLTAGDRRINADHLEDKIKISRNLTE